jgi:hypothetical protein
MSRLPRKPEKRGSKLSKTYDEAGGFYDHVSPQPMPSPDGIAPMDLVPGDICDSTGTTGGATCDFTYTGFRLPLIVISPFAKKNFVSHQVRDYTAILKLIETRFNVPALTNRDAAQKPSRAYRQVGGLQNPVSPSDVCRGSTLVARRNSSKALTS